MPRRPQKPPDATEQEGSRPVERGQVRALLAEAQAISARLAALNEVATTMQASLDLERVLETMAREARWILDFQYCSAAERLGESYSELVLKSPFKATPTTRRAPLSSSPIGLAMERGHALVLRSGAEVAGLAPGMQSGLIVPLRAGDEVIGTLNFLAERPGHYTQDDLRVISALAAQVSAAAQNSRLFREATDARNQLRIVLESISDGVVVLAEDGRVLHANTGALRLLHGDSIAPGRHMLSVAARARARGQRLLDREQLRALAGQFRRHSGGTLRLSDGRHIEWAAARLLEGAITPGFVISLRDISDKVALEQLREDMISMLVHDLRTPLTGVLLSLDMLTQSRASGLALEEGELIDRASESAKQLLRHINALLDMSKLEAGRLELEIQPLSVAPLLARVAGRFRLLAELGKMELVIDAPPGLPALPADPILIERVLENLIGNALKFTDEGGAVTVGARPLPGPEPALELYVRDTGVGVPPELRTVIFEKYGQAHNPKARRGTGLGLTFCKLAVEAHCGRIGLRETPGGGSTFWVELPLSGGR